MKDVRATVYHVYQRSIIHFMQTDGTSFILQITDNIGIYR